MNEDIQFEKAVVLEMPQSIRDSITAMRQLLDPAMLQFPIDITLVGSSGVGPIESEHSNDAVIEAVSRAFSDVHSFSFRFRGVTHFPNTHLYFLEPEDRTVFDQLHQRLLDCGLRYKECSFGYTPHCTICRLHNPTQEDILRVQALTYPEGEIEITKASLWSFGKNYQSLHAFHEIGFAEPEPGEVRETSSRPSG